jgi:polygalacturonase
VAIEEGAYFKGKVDIQKDMAKTDGARTAAAASSSAAASASGGSTVAVKTNPSEGK